MKTLEELAVGFDRLSASRSCEKLMDTYSYLHTKMMHEEYMKLWAHRDDCRLEMPWGVYESYEGVKRCYLKDHGDRSYPETQQLLHGLLCVHAMGTSIIEVAGDGKTAKGVWISPGFETSAEDGKADCVWAWSEYGVDFILDTDGNWKIWKMKIYPLFRAPYDKCWTDIPPYDGFMLDVSIDHPLEKPIWNYDPNKQFPMNYPPIPAPYETYDDVGFNW